MKGGTQPGQAGNKKNPVWSGESQITNYKLQTKGWERTQWLYKLNFVSM